jgi:GH15 family glucan-1,4-alpha-glucosidase
VWRLPDQGIWEARGEPQHYISSKLMCWVGLDRAARLANIRGEAELSASWAETAAEIKSDILEHGVDSRGVLRQHYNTEALDASTLLAGIFGFLPGDDARLRATVLAIADDLTEQGFVLRYRTEQTDDGLSGKEGSFLICSFWLVSALAIIGETQRARHPDGPPREGRIPARAVCGGVRRRDRRTPRELSAGLFAPRIGRGCRANHPRRGPAGSGRLTA